jgi:ParB/RepB/Spo0J family partition protein
MANPNKLIIIGLDTDDGPEHPLWDERIGLKLSPALIKSVEAHGVIEPIIINEKDEVIAGRQRTRAARQAGVPDVETISYDTNGNEPMLIAATENELRQNDDQLTKAERLKRMKDQGCDWPDLAIAFGVSQKQCRNYLKLASVPDFVKKAVRAENLSPTAAFSLDENITKEEFFDYLASGKATVAKAKKSKGKNGAHKFVYKKNEPIKRKGLVKLGKVIDLMLVNTDKPMDEGIAETFKGVDATKDFWWGVYWAVGQLGGSIDGLADDEVSGIDKLLKKIV